MNDWRTDFENAPTDGTRFEVRRDDCPGYDTTAVISGGRLELASFFIRNDMWVFSRPTHWKEVTQ